MDYDQLIFIKERSNPQFFDAIRISNQHDSYHSISLPYIYDSSIQITYHQHSLILESKRSLTIEEAFNILQNFAVKNGKKVAYITHCPSVLEQKKKRQGMRTRKGLKL